MKEMKETKKLKIAQIGVGHDHATAAIRTLKEQSDLYEQECPFLFSVIYHRVMLAGAWTDIAVRQDALDFLAHPFPPPHRSKPKSSANAMSI